MAQGKQALLDRLPSAKKRLLDRIPGRATEEVTAPAGPVMAGNASLQNILGERQSDLEGGTLSQVGHGAIESFMKLPELAGRVQSALPREAARLLARIIPSTKPAMEAFEGTLPKPGMSHQLAQAALPITEEEHGTVASQLGQVAGGLAQVPILGPAGIPGLAAGFGGQSGMVAYDDAKAQGGSELDAWKAAAVQGGLSAASVAATAGLATRFNVNSGGILSKLVKNAALGVGVGATEQTVSNLMTRYTAEKDRAAFTGLKGRAATDAAVGLLMTALFPGHKPSKRVREAVESVKLAEPLAPKVPESIPEAAQLVGMEGTTAKQVEPTDPFLAKTQELQATQAALSEIEAKNRGKRASTGDIEERLRLVNETQRLALESQEAAAAQRVPEEPNPDADFFKALGDPSYRAELESMAEQAGGTAPGGHPSTDPATGERIPNYAAANVEWWDARPGGMSKAEIQSMVAKLSKAPEGTVPKFTPRQLTMLEYMLHNTAESRGSQRRAEAAAMWGEERPTAEILAEAQRQGRDRRQAQGYSPDAPSTGFESLTETGGGVSPDWFTRAEHDVPPEKVPLGVGSDPEELALQAQRVAGKLMPEVEGDTSFDPSSWETELHAAVAEHTGNTKLADEAVRAAKAAEAIVGKPPGPPNPPTPPEAIPAPGEPGGGAHILHWIGEKQLAHARADMLGGGWRKSIDSTLTGGFGRFVKERFGPRTNRARFRVEKAGQLALDLSGKLDEEYGKFGSKLTAEQRAILEDAEKLSPGQRRVIAEVEANNLEWSKLALDEKVISRYYETYTKRLWKGIESLENAVRARVGSPKFATFTTGALPRSYSSILEGWAKGNVLKVESFVDAAVMNMKTIADVIANRNLIEEGRKAGWLKTAPNLDAGWARIEHPNFTDEVIRAKISAHESAEVLRDHLSGSLGEEVSLDEAVKVFGRAREGKTSIVVGRDMRIVPRGDDILVFQDMPLYASKEDARIINNVLGRSELTKFAESGTLGGRAFGVLDKFSVIAKTMRTAMVQDNVVWIAMRNFLAAPANTPADILTLKPYFRGQKMIAAWGEDLQAGVRDGGLRLSPSADVAPFFELEKGRVSKALDSLKITGAPKAFVENAYIDLNNFLYGKYIPAYKAHLYTLELARLRKANHEGLMRGTIQDTALVKAAAQLSNNIMAGQNFQREGRNPTAMHGAQLLVFAPDRMVSTIRTATDAFKAGAVGQAHRVLWARMASRYIFAWAAFNLASAWADDPEHPLENFKKRASEHYGVGMREFLGWDAEPILRAAGRNNPSRLFVNLTAQTSEPIEALNDPARYGARKLGIVPRMAMSFFAGEDYFGKRYTTLPELTGTDDKGVYQTTRLPDHVAGMPKGGKLAGQVSSYQSDAGAGPIGPSQVPSYVAGNLPLPFELENWIEVVRGQTDAYDALLQSFGFRTMAPSLKRQEAAGIDVQGPAMNFGKEMRARYMRAAELGAN